MVEEFCEEVSLHPTGGGSGLYRDRVRFPFQGQTTCEQTVQSRKGHLGDTFF